MTERRASARYWFNAMIPVGVRGMDCELLGHIANISEKGVLIWLEYQVNEPQPDETVRVEITLPGISYKPSGQFVRFDRQKAAFRFNQHFDPELIVNLLTGGRWSR
jgi:hypothetical protein